MKLNRQSFLKAFRHIYIYIYIVKHSELRKHSQNIKERFVEKGYNELTVRKKIERVDHLDRSLLLKHCKPKGIYSITLKYSSK